MTRLHDPRHEEVLSSLSSRLARQYFFLRLRTAARFAAAFAADVVASVAGVRTIALEVAAGFRRTAGFLRTAAVRGFAARAISIPNISERSPSSRTFPPFR